MADESIWKEVALGFGAAIVTLIGVVYKTLTGQLRDHKEEDKSQDTAIAALLTRMALQEQISQSQHGQVLESLGRLTSDIREWRTDSKEWRDGLSENIREINERFAEYDRNIAAFYRENTHLKKPEGG